MFTQYQGWSENTYTASEFFFSMPEIALGNKNTHIKQYHMHRTQINLQEKQCLSRILRANENYQCYFKIWFQNSLCSREKNIYYWNTAADFLVEMVVFGYYINLL